MPRPSWLLSASFLDVLWTSATQLPSLFEHGKPNEPVITNRYSPSLPTPKTCPPFLQILCSHNFCALNLMHVCIMLPNFCIVVRLVSMNYMLDFGVSVREYYIRYWLYVHDTSTIVTLSPGILCRLVLKL